MQPQKGEQGAQQTQQPWIQHKQHQQQGCGTPLGRDDGAGVGGSAAAAAGQRGSIADRGGRGRADVLVKVQPALQPNAADQAAAHERATNLLMAAALAMSAKQAKAAEH